VATITKTKSGYRAQVYVKGQRDSKVLRTKREADIWAAARETDLRTYQAATPNERHSLTDALNKYADEVSPTKRGARWEVVRIQTFLRNQHLRCAEPIGKLTTARLAEWRDARLCDVSAGTVKREISLLSDILETARREWQWLQVNPIRDMRKPSAPPSRKVTISRAQIKLMLRAMGYSPRLRIATVSQCTAMCFLLALRTGMRAGELCGLSWDRVHDGYCHLPITKTTARDVPLTDKAMCLIDRLRGWDSELVFGLKAQTLDALFRKYRQRAGLTGFTFHDTRHTAATWIVKSGKWNVLELCKAFGWSDPKQAMVYFNPTAKELADKRR
jgi:integrase